MGHPLGWHDAVLAFSLLYSCFDLKEVWEDFSACHQPLHYWQVVCYAFVVVFRLIHLAADAPAAASGTAEQESADPVAPTEFLLDLRPKGRRRSLLALMWFVAMPAFVLWTAIGTWWFWAVKAHTRYCMPSDAHFWFAALWLLLCYVSVAVYFCLAGTACRLESRLRRAESALRCVECPDMVARWGPQLRRFADYRALGDISAAAAAKAPRGLTPEELSAMPSSRLGATSTELPGARDVDVESAGGECSICLCNLAENEEVRELSICGHVFHRSCIDLWLLRQAHCPLCKSDLTRPQPTT